ncbi:integrin-linked protein kinase-like [Mytilus trossulus]|uniref:integrin-linked protein kinase-like n=1 Tax=Mytilus trossulus TaxID=6551 RepID=UPI003007873B
MSTEVIATGVTLKTAPSARRTKSHSRANRVRPKDELTGLKIVVTPKDTKEFNRLGIQLLQVIRNGNAKQALKLIGQNADVSFCDQAGWSAMHHAASNGFVELIIQLREKEALVDALDCSNETPLHKASRKGHAEAVIVLITFGADISAVNSNGETALEIAVKAGQTTVVETLCMLGVEVLLQDWSWSMVDDNELSKKQKKIIEILVRQHWRSSGYAQKSIQFEVFYLKARENKYLENLGVNFIGNDEAEDKETIENNGADDDGFFVFCGKMKSEYSDVTNNQHKDNTEIVSDIYECRLWCNERKTLRLNVRLKTVLASNENLIIMSTNEKIGRINCIDKFTDHKNPSKHYSAVHVTISVKKTSVVFYFGKLIEPEKFSIGSKAVTLKPKGEPEAEISIPKGSFESEGQMFLQIVDTKDVNEEEKEDESGDMLTTNIVNISMTDGQQPNQEIGIKIPIHHKLSEDDAVVILATSSDAPCSVDDWEVMEAEMDESGKSATFRIRHFSIYAGSSKEKVKTDLPGVVDAVERSINRQRKIEFIFLTKWVNADSQLLVIEGTAVRKSEGRIKYWARQGYNEKSLKRSKEFCVKNGQSFMFTLFGNLVEVSREESFTLTYQNNRDNFRLFNICLDDSNKPFTGEVQISLEKEVKQTIPFKKSGLFSCCSAQRVKKVTNIEQEILQTICYEVIKTKAAFCLPYAVTSLTAVLKMSKVTLGSLFLDEEELTEEDF